jgi:isopentenyl phosphate kinase
MQRSEKIKQIRIINGLKRGNILAAMRGENVGTLIRAN